MKKVFCFFIIIGFVSCQKSTDSYLSNVPLVPKDNIYVVLDSFVRENENKDYIYELYINKETPHDYVLTVYCGVNSLTAKENKYNNQIPVNYTMISGKKFNIYSGIEHYFQKETDTIVDVIVDESQKKNVWIVIDSFDVISIYKGIEYSYPFVHLPIRFTESIFTPPTVK